VDMGQISDGSLSIHVSEAFNGCAHCSNARWIMWLAGMRKLNSERGPREQNGPYIFLQFPGRAPKFDFFVIQRASSPPPLSIPFPPEESPFSLTHSEQPPSTIQPTHFTSTTIDHTLNTITSPHTTATHAHFSPSSRYRHRTRKHVPNSRRRPGHQWPHQWPHQWHHQWRPQRFQVRTAHTLLQRVRLCHHDLHRCHEITTDM
jgi:hypothetical protein